jgi:uncharacterized membrane protein YgdD (TMEM256/DUF423 family)
MRPWIILAGLNGAMGVAMAAVGAHAFAGDPTAQEWVAKAAQFQLIHALALLAAERMPLAATAFFFGILCFSGSLYLKALGLAQWLPGPVTPVGGILLMAGWGLLALAGFRRR